VKKLAIITTHPIQYNAPLFRILAKRQSIQIKVFYTWGQTEQGVKYDPGFDKEIIWDLPLLDGYDYSFVKNIAPDPGTHHFKGIISPTLITDIEEWNPDVILVFGWSFKSHLKCLRHFKKKIPVLFRGDSTLMYEQPGIKKIIRRYFLRWIYRHVDLAFYVGTQNKLYYLKHGLKESQLVFAPHAVDNDRFFDKNGGYEEKATTWRRQLNIPVDDMVFLFAGKLEPKKNPELLFKAFEIIRTTGSYGQTGIHLLIVGNGILENELKKKYIANLNVYFIDFQNQSLMPVIYRLGNVFVLPSVGPGETWGLSVNEAMACSKPVIVSDKCGCAIDLVENGKNGFIFKSNDLSDLIEKMQILRDSKKQIEMGKHSKQVIREWTIERICQKIEDIVLSK